MREEAERNADLYLLELLEDPGDGVAERDGVVAEADDVAGGAGHAEEGGGALLLERRRDLLGRHLELHLQIHQVLLQRVLRVPGLARRVDPPLGIELLVREGTEIQHHLDGVPMRARARLLRFWSSDQEGGDDGVRRNFASLIRGIFLCDLTGLLVNEEGHCSQQAKFDLCKLSPLLSSFLQLHP